MRFYCYLCAIIRVDAEKLILMKPFKVRERPLSIFKWLLYFIMESNIEVWKHIPGYEGIYQCSNLGRIRGVDRLDCRNRECKGVIMKQTVGNVGYKTVYLWNNGKKKTIRTHQVVAMSFLNHTQCRYSLVVNHKNGNRLDNNVENLEVVTARYNSQHSSQMRVDSKSSIYTGVVYREKHNIYQVTVTINSKHVYIGVYSTDVEANNMYLSAIEAHEKGEFEAFYQSVIDKRLSKQSSIYEGVCFHKVSKRWKSRVNVDGKRLHIGSFKTEQEAYMARKNYISLLFGFKRAYM